MTQQVVPRLGEMFPLETEAWKNWKQASKPVLEGSWRVAGYLPEKGDYDGRSQPERRPRTATILP